MKYARLRKWHTALGVAIALPLITMGITGSLIIHNRPLGFRDIMVHPEWLPGYQAENAKNNDLKDVKALLSLENGHSFLGTDYGLVETTPIGSRLVPEIPRTTVSSIQTSSRGVLACSPKGVWLQEGTSWRQIYKGECKQASESPGKTLQVIAEGKGVLSSIDGGRHWGPEQSLQKAMAILPKSEKRKPLTLTRFLLDIHTGHILFGKEWKWFWVDFLACVTFMLSLSGLWLWARGRKARKGAKH